MFGFGFTEMAVIVLVAVMLFPPRELPKIARSIAKFYGQIRKTADDFRHAIMQDEDLNEPIREIRSVYNEARYEVKRAEETAKRELAKARMEARMAARSVTDAVKPPSGDKPAANDAAPVSAVEEANREPTDEPAVESAPEAPKEREMIVSSTAGSARPEDAPPGRKPRSKLSMPAALIAKGADEDDDVRDGPIPAAPPVPGIEPRTKDDADGENQGVA